MIRDDMMDRMSALEFSEWMALERMAYAPTDAEHAPVQRPAQTPQQILDMFPVTKAKPPKPPIDDSFRMGVLRRNRTRG